MMLGSPINSVHTNDSGEAPPEDHPEAPACCPGVPLTTGMHNARPLTAPVMSRSSGASHKHQRSSFTQSPTRLRSTSGPLISQDQDRPPTADSSWSLVRGQAVRALSSSDRPRVAAWAWGHVGYNPVVRGASRGRPLPL